MTQHEFIDTKSDRTYRFDGELLAHASSHRPGRARWSEISLFKTRGGEYILVKAGRSLVFHAKRSCAGPFAKSAKGPKIGDAYRERIPCQRCVPVGRPEGGIHEIFNENDLVTVIRSKSAEGVVESAHILDEDEVLTLPYLAQRMLQDAGTKDEAIKAAYAVEVVA